MQWTSIGGIEVITSQEPDVRHPRWGYDHPVKLDGATELLLSDGTRVVVCDSCSYNGVTGYGPYVKPEGEVKDVLHQSDSVSAHINGMHHPNKSNRRTSFYDDERIRVCIKIWLKWKHTNIKNWTQKACEELDQMGVKPFRGTNWHNGQLGSLVREQIRKPKFKNLKAAQLTDDDKAYLASLVRDSAAATSAQDVRSTLLGSNVRITEKKHEHVPVDFEKIIEEQEAAKQQEEAIVPAGDPVLTFVPFDEDERPVPPKPAPRRKPDPLLTTIVTVPSVEIIGGDFKHVTDLPDGSPLFTYKGVLMVGRPVKDVQT